jgi:hypothetical protein
LVVIVTVEATEARLFAVAVMVLFTSVTTSENVNVPGVAGAVNVGLTAVVLDSETGVPAVCVHA